MGMTVEPASRAAEARKEQQVKNERKAEAEPAPQQDDAVVVEMNESSTESAPIDEPEPQQEKPSEAKVDQMA